MLYLLHNNNNNDNNNKYFSNLDHCVCVLDFIFYLFLDILVLIYGIGKHNECI